MVTWCARKRAAVIITLVMVLPSIEGFVGDRIQQDSEVCPVPHSVHGVSLSKTEEWVRLGEYEYHKGMILGTGGFGVVYEGRAQKSKDKKVAVKEINCTKNENYQREIDVLKEVASLEHENIVRLLYSEERSDVLYLVMEFCNKDLATYLKDHKRLSETTAALFLKQIVSGLEALKSHNILHRDLKPGNFLLSYTVENPKPEEITVKIADFGLARDAPDCHWLMTKCGTKCYAAPEVITAETYDYKADIWSVGVTMHEMIFGSLPFPVYRSQTEKLYKCPSGVSAQLEDLLNRMLKQNPTDRIDLHSLANHPFLCQGRA